MAKDYYRSLGVPKDANDKQIKQAFRRLARQYHPDVNTGGKPSEDKFKEINEAYEVLSDAEKRRLYDQFGDQWRAAEQAKKQGFDPSAATAPRSGPRVRVEDPYGFGQGGATEVRLEDLLGDILSGGRAGGGRRTRTPTIQRFEVPVELTLDEAFAGTTRVLEVPGTGRRVEARIPPGVDTGSRVHLPLEATIDVNLVVQVQSHPRFRRTANDLHVTTRVPVEDLVLGGEAMVPTLKSTVALRIPPGTQAGQVFRLGGKGMPHLGNLTVLGNLYATVEALLPQHLSDEERMAFELLRKRREAK